MPIKSFSKSAPENQLREFGTLNSGCLLNLAIDELPDEALERLETELDFYTQTGLIGVHMSRLITLLRVNGSLQAA